MKRRDREQGETEVLAAATKLFARLGFERTSLAAVGEAAGVSRGLPTYFFGSKQDLYRAVFERATEQVRTCVLSAAKSLSDRTPIEQVLKSIIDSYLDFLNANPDAVRLLQWESLSPAARRQTSPTALFDDAVELVNQALRRSGRTHVNGRFLLLSVVGMCFFPFGTVDVFRHKPQRLSAYKEHVLNFALHGIGGVR